MLELEAFVCEEVHLYDSGKDRLSSFICGVDEVDDIKDVFEAVLLDYVGQDVFVFMVVDSIPVGVFHRNEAAEDGLSKLESSEHERKSVLATVGFEPELAYVD